MSHLLETTCHLQFGCAEQSLDALLKSCLSLAGVELVWREPVNRRARVNGFLGLCRPADLGTRDTSQPRLSEAKLFLKNGLLHFVANDSITRFAAWFEETVPTGLATLLSATTSTQQSPTLLRNQRDILLRRSSELYETQRGLATSSLGDKVAAFEYFDQGRLRWWRIVPPSPSVGASS